MPADNAEDRESDESDLLRPRVAEDSLRPPQVGEIDEGPQDENPNIDDRELILQIERLKELRAFLLNEAATYKHVANNIPTFGHLNLLRFSYSGRGATADEWTQVENHTREMFQLITEPLRKKLILTQLPNWLTAQLPIISIFLASGALLAAVVAHSHTWVGVFGCYLIWLMTLGAMGAVAFIGMNVLAVQEDITFELNEGLIRLRVVLGALFGVVLTLPFGFNYFIIFIERIKDPGEDVSNAIFKQAIFLLLPFVLGFSTSLVIMIMNRLTDSIQAFFGARERRIEKRDTSLDDAVDRSNPPISSTGARKRATSVSGPTPAPPSFGSSPPERWASQDGDGPSPR